MAKIILIAPPTQFTDQIHKALIGLGHAVLLLSDRKNFFVPSYFQRNELMWRVVRRIPKLRSLNNKLFARELIEISKNYKPDLVFINKGMIVKEREIRMLQSLGIKVVNWFIDNMNHDRYKSWFIHNHGMYDYFLSFDSHVQGKNVIYCPLAIDPESFIGSKDKEYLHDVCFIGAPYPERITALSAVASLPVSLGIYGWKGWEKTPLAPYYRGPVSLAQSAHIYQNSKISINMNLEPACAGLNLKTFEIPASRGFQLTDYRDDLSEVYEIGKEVDFFKSLDELKSKVQYYVSNDELRDSIAEAGYERTIKSHTLKKRLSDILTKIL